MRKIMFLLGVFTLPCLSLAQSNPDNTEVTLILSNLQAGKQPFDGAQPPVTNTPQDRTTAPVSQ